MSTEPNLASLEARVVALEDKISEMNLPMLYQRLGQLFGGNGGGEHGQLMLTLRNIEDRLPRPWTDLQKIIAGLVVAILLGFSSWCIRTYNESQTEQNLRIEKLSEEVNELRLQMKVEHDAIQQEEKKH